MSDLQDGRYRARGREGDWGYAGTGTEQVAVLFELEGGHRRTWYGYMTEKTEDRTLEVLKICGVTDLSTLAGVDANEVEVVLRTEEFNGERKQRIAFVNALGSGSVAMRQRMSESEKQSFAQRLKGKWLEMGGAAPAASSQFATTGSDDEIPF